MSLTSIDSASEISRSASAVLAVSATVTLSASLTSMSASATIGVSLTVTLSASLMLKSPDGASMTTVGVSRTTISSE